MAGGKKDVDRGAEGKGRRSPAVNQLRPVQVQGADGGGSLFITNGGSLTFPRPPPKIKLFDYSEDPASPETNADEFRAHTMLSQLGWPTATLENVPVRCTKSKKIHFF